MSGFPDPQPTVDDLSRLTPEVVADGTADPEPVTESGTEDPASVGHGNEAVAAR
ncbi:hypothetical protein ACIQVK_09645 [Streptomyces sp. NPDC090493]|uniref:hypothetical protein n=1 Tax=Streptomyces sp. NPDC090493 TaxID=3365964 RepID=UPI0038133853